MTILRKYYRWSTSPLDWSKSPFETCSPNLLLIRRELERLFGVGQYLGCEGDRDIRAGGSISTHAYGAAFDWRYPNGTADLVIAWLIDNSGETGVDSIHDYLRSRIWHAGRTSDEADAHTSWWLAQTPSAVNGMGQSWANYLHIETHLDFFFNDTPLSQRIIVPPPPPPPVIPPDDNVDDDDMKPILYTVWHATAEGEFIWMKVNTATDTVRQVANGNEYSLLKALGAVEAVAESVGHFNQMIQTYQPIGKLNAQAKAVLGDVAFTEWNLRN